MLWWTTASLSNVRMNVEQGRLRADNAICAPDRDGSGSAPFLDDFEVTLGRFGPLETEAMARIPHHLQRLWKHRGHIVGGKSYAQSRFSSLEVLELCVRHRLSGCSVPPGRSGDLGRQAAPIAFMAALRHLDGAVEIVGPVAKVDEALGRFRIDPQIIAAICGSDWRERRRYLWSADGGAFRLGEPGDVELHSGNSELLIVIDLVTLGTELGRKAPRPLVTLTHREGDRDMFVRRRTAGLELDNALRGLCS